MRAVCQLIALVPRQWLLEAWCGKTAERSLVRAAQTVRREMPALLRAVASRRRLTIVQTIRHCLTPAAGSLAAAPNRIRPISSAIPGSAP